MGVKNEGVISILDLDRCIYCFFLLSFTEMSICRCKIF